MNSLRFTYLLGILFGFIAIVIDLWMLAVDFNRPNKIILLVRIIIFSLFMFTTLSCVRRYRRQMRIMELEEKKRQEKENAHK